jgi:HlyD family secretion protein
MKKRIFWIIGILVVGLAIWGFGIRGRKPESEIQYSYETVKRGDVIQSISATGVLQAKTAVDVKSKAGGKVVQLTVDVGSIVKQGQVIAMIDPSDTKSTYDQAQADLSTSQARAAQARTNYTLGLANANQAVQNARVNLQQAQTRFARVQLQAQQQPVLTSSSIASAQAAYDAAVAAESKVNVVTVPQMQQDAQGALDKAKADLDAASANYSRQQQLLAKGYVAQAAVDAAKSTLESARSSFNTAQQKIDTINQEIAAQRKAAQTDTARARAALNQARASQSDTGVARTNVSEAQENVRLAKIALDQAVSDQLNNRVRQQDVVAAQASTVRSTVALANAKVQLESTTVVAPRDGVVTAKYLEEGTIIPPGTSTFAQGTSLVQISDVSSLYVVCTVDEADIGHVKAGQKVKIVTEAFPDKTLRGVVDRVDPAATTTSSVTSVAVRVRVFPKRGVQIMPGMNATCEFITLEKDNVIMVPSQAIKDGPSGSYVLLKGSDPKHPVQTSVQVGEVGNDGTEILSGVKEGDQIVTAELDIAKLKAIQDQMAQDQNQSGGLGSSPNMRRTTSRGTTNGGGGARAGGGRGGGGGGRGG